MNDFMCRVQAALERDMHHMSRGRLLGEGDYQRAQEIIEAEIKKQVEAKVVAEVERQTRALEEERSQFRKREVSLEAKIRSLRDAVGAYAIQRKGVEEKRERVIAAYKLAEERREKARLAKLAAEKREINAEQAAEQHETEMKQIAKEARRAFIAKTEAEERAEKRRLTLMRTKLYRDTRGWRDQYGNHITDEQAAEIQELHSANCR